MAQKRNLNFSNDFNLKMCFGEFAVRNLFPNLDINSFVNIFLPFSYKILISNKKKKEIF